jgi:hypothetical protein
MSLGREEGSPAKLSDELPSSPPDSPGRYRQVWTVMKQREEELEDKHRQLEEWDFDLQEEKRQHRESRLFLARKMSELEARELRAAKEEERRLSRNSTLSGSPTPSMEKMTPPSSCKTRSPKSLGTLSEDSKLSHDFEDRSTQTDISTYQEQAPFGRRLTCKQLCRFGLVFSLAVKVCVLIAAVVLPRFSSGTVQNLAAWLPLPLSTSVPPASDESLLYNCSGILHETRLAFTVLQHKHDELEKMMLAGSESLGGSDNDAASLAPASDQLPAKWTWLSFWDWLLGA